MMKLILSTLITLFAVGCGGPRYVEYFPHHDDGTPKPKVALIPVVDSSKSGLTWDMSRELSEGIYYELMNSGQIYVMQPQEIGPIWNQRGSIDFFAPDMSFAKDFACADFVVAMELVDHTVKSVDSCNRVLTLNMRLRVMDVRYDKPRVVLYELVKADYQAAIPSNDVTGGASWGDRGYSLTPCAKCHQRMIDNVAARLEQVLWSAK